MQHQKKQHSSAAKHNRADFGMEQNHSERKRCQKQQQNQPCRKRTGDNFSIKIIICMKMRQMMFVVITPIHFYQNSIKHFSGVSASNLSFRRSGCSGFRYRSSLLTSLRSVAVAASRPYHPTRNKANLSLDGLLLCHCRACPVNPPFYISFYI